VFCAVKCVFFLRQKWPKCNGQCPEPAEGKQEVNPIPRCKVMHAYTSAVNVRAITSAAVF